VYGNYYIADTGNNAVRMVTSLGTINTIAGIGSSAGNGGDGGAAISATLNQPHAIAVDVNKNVYIADYQNNKIRMVLNSAGTISTYAGTGTSGNSGDGGPATYALLNGPQGVAVDSNGNVYISDSANNIIRMDNTLGIISTIAGTGTAGDLGDGWVATSARMNGPQGIWVDANNNVYIADYNNNKIKVVWSKVPTVLPVFDFENIVSDQSSLYQYYTVGSVIGGWTTGGLYSVGYAGASNPGGGIAIVSSLNNVGFVAPFPSTLQSPYPSNLQYACWIATINNAKASITRTLTGMVVGNPYVVSVWMTGRSATELPPSQSFTVVMDGVTVYSTAPSSYSWVQVTTTTKVASRTYMILTFQLSNLGGSGHDYSVVVDAIALQIGPSPRPSSQPTNHPTHPTSRPSNQPSLQPSSQPSAQPVMSPSGCPSVQPSGTKQLHLAMMFSFLMCPFLPSFLSTFPL